MNTNKKTALYLALTIAFGLGSAQVQAQTVDMGDVADYPVQVDDDDVADPEIKMEPIQQQKQALKVLVDEQDTQEAIEEAAQETEMALQQQEEELAHDIELSRKIERHDAEMADYLKSQ